MASKINLLFGWFDILAVGMVAAGLFVGRRRGMSAELMSLLMWLGIVLGGAQLSPMLGRWFGRSLGTGPTWSFVLAYLSIATALGLLTMIVRRQLGDKIVSGDAFGGFEYYLGMVAGVVRFVCILIFILALVHAPHITDTQIQAQLKSQNESLGSIYFPPFGQIQRSIFKGSITGRAVDAHLDFVLIKSDPSVGGGGREGIARQREREVYDVIDPRR